MFNDKIMIGSGIKAARNKDKGKASCNLVQKVIQHFG